MIVWRDFVRAGVVLAVTAAGSAAQPPAAPSRSVADRLASCRAIDGFVPLCWDESHGRMLLAITRFDQEFLYQVSLASGIGSNPIGLDRGQMGPSAVVRFERVGPRVLLVQPNYNFRALGAPAAEQRAVADSFATSTLWGFAIEAEEPGRVLVDATAFFLRDAHGVAGRLRAAKQGSYRLDESRSAFYLPRTRAFPKNTEVEVSLTLTTDDVPGPLVSQTTPTPSAVSVREHFSLVELPGPGYTPRAFDPRVGFYPQTIYDYASPITAPLEVRWITRHRLQKKDPSAARSEPVTPIVYYVDNGAPEPIRQALVDGASWWNQAFEAAGFINAFQVKVLPPDADPLDIRYNVINWVHRSTRGWSYGGSIVDPRTGEMIKADVTLGSLRVRQDLLIYGGLGARAGGDGSDDLRAEDLLPADDAAGATAIALARLRQLAAHEVGHTLGLEHNFAASSYGRASVMDYPAPLVKVVNGALDLSDAYARGLGPYDTWAIQFGYSQLPDGADEAGALSRIVEDGVSRGLRFVCDSDARPPGAGQSLGSLWDNGPEAVAALEQQIEVRRIALANFGLDNLPVGQPASLLEARLLPIYLLHRFQLQAAAKSLGGADFSYSVRTAAGLSPAAPLAIVPAARQRAALSAILATIDPGFLAIPPRVLALIPPPAFGFDTGTQELFARHETPFFDPLSAAAVAANLAVSALLQPERAARLVDFHARDDANPDFDEVVGALIRRAFGAAPAPAGQSAIARAVQNVVVSGLIGLAANQSAAFQVRAGARRGLKLAGTRLATASDSAGTALREDIERYLSRPETQAPRTPLPETPPGEPIG